MIMHPVNWGVGVPGMGNIEGVPGFTGTEDGPLSNRLKNASARLIGRGGRRIGSRSRTRLRQP